jgi:NADH-quinone oxidoreductase subunit L
VNGAAKIIGWFSRQAQAFQSGFVRNYALFMVVGFISLLLVMF